MKNQCRFENFFLGHFLDTAKLFYIDNIYLCQLADGLGRVIKIYDRLYWATQETIKLVKLVSILSQYAVF